MAGGASSVQIQDGGVSRRKTSVVASTSDVTKNGVVIVNPDGSSIGSTFPTTYLKLNQTTPQTVINGTPIFDEGLTTNDSITNYGNYQMLTDGTSMEIWTKDIDAIKIMSAGSNYSKLSFGVNTTSGYTYVQSVKQGSGTLLPISFWNGSNRAWDISTAGHLLSGGTGATVQNITTKGTISAGNLNTFACGDSGIAGGNCFTGLGTGVINSGDLWLTDTAYTMFGKDIGGNFRRRIGGNAPGVIVHIGGNDPRPDESKK